MHNIDENEVLRDALSGLNEDVPPMPEGLHAAWMHKVEDDMHDTRIEKTRTRKSLTRFLSVAAAMVFVVGGTLLTRDSLSPKNASQENGAGLTRSEPQLYGTAYANDYGYAADADYAVEESAEAEYSVMTTAMTRGAGSGSLNAKAAPTEKKIIRTADMTIATQRYDESLAALRGSCEELEGWVESSSERVSSSTGLRTANLTLRIPQTALDGYLAGADGLGRITARSEYTEDVTASYQDTQARLDTQLALMERLQALITESGDLSDLLALESQIADTQYQIDALQSSLNRTDRQVTYSTVNVTLKEEKTAELTDTTVSFGERLTSALRLGGEVFVGFLADMAVFLLAALPFIGIVAAAFLIVHIIKRRKK